MTHHAYPTPAMVGDYARAAAGLCPTIAIFTMMPVGPVGAAVLGGFAALFAAFGIRTVLRHTSRLEMSDGVLRATGLRRTSISLRELDSIKLAYYSTRRDGRGGWMQLELRSESSTMRLDSRIEGFAELVAASAKAANIRGLSLNAATLANLQGLGVEFVPAEAHSEPATGEAA
jgi:hypothetical protein